MQAFPCGFGYRLLTSGWHPAGMPTVLRILGYWFFFYSLEGDEPPHIHVEHGDKLARYWIDPVELASAARFRDHELGRIRALVQQHRRLFMEAWNGHFRRQP